MGSEDLLPQPGADRHPLRPLRPRPLEVATGESSSEELIWPEKPFVLPGALALTDRLVNFPWMSHLTSLATIDPMDYLTRPLTTFRTVPRSLQSLVRRIRQSAIRGLCEFRGSIHQVASENWYLLCDRMILTSVTQEEKPEPSLTRPRSHDICAAIRDRTFKLVRGSWLNLLAESIIIMDATGRRNMDRSQADSLNARAKHFFRKGLQGTIGKAVAALVSRGVAEATPAVVNQLRHLVQGEKPLPPHFLGVGTEWRHLRYTVELDKP